MTNRDLVWVAILVVALGFVAGVFFLLGHRSASLVRGSAADAGLATEPTPLPQLDPEPDPDDTADVADAHAPPAQVTPPAPLRARDAAPSRLPDASSPHDSAPPIVARAQNLLIHLVGHDKLCMDYSSHKDALHLFQCHGNPNQRWTATEDAAGAIRLMSAQGGCVITQGTTKDGEPGLTLGECGAPLRFRHFEEHRLQETQTGKCVAARRLDKGTRLSLEPCDASNPGQAWTMQ